MDENLSSIIESYYQRYYHTLYLRACSMLGQSPDSEVAVQEAFAVACQKSEQFISSDDPLRWLKRTVDHMALHTLRERKRTMAIFLPLEELNTNPSFDEQPDNCMEMLDFFQSVVTKEELQFFLNIASHKTSVLEEAKNNNIKVSTCYKRFERIRDKLQLALEKFRKV